MNNRWRHQLPAYSWKGLADRLRADAYEWPAATRAVEIGALDAPRHMPAGSSVEASVGVRGTPTVVTRAGQ
jgi:hypothetical protein